MAIRQPISIHRRILRQLALFWLLVSLVAGGTVFVVERHRLNSAVVDLVVDESVALSQNIAPIFDALQSLQKESWRDRLRSMVKEHCLFLQIYDSDKQLVSEVISPRHQDQGEQLRHLFGRGPEVDAAPHYRKLQYSGEVVVQVILPFMDKRQNISGYCNAVFMVDQAALARLENNLFRTLGVILTVILLTTLALYPLILSLNRDVLTYSEQVLHHNFELISVLGTVIALRDSDTALHNYRVTLYAIGLAEALGLPPAQMPQLILGAFLHDVGKVGIGDALLHNPGALSGTERQRMQEHVGMGMEIIRNSEWLQTGMAVIAAHHERYDGSGYPQGLSGCAIPLVARIFAIVDVFDALRSERPYKNAMPLEQCIAAIAQESGHHFDPSLVAVFVPIAEQLNLALAPLDEQALIDRLYRVAIAYFAPFPIVDPKR